MGQPLPPTGRHSHLSGRSRRIRHDRPNSRTTGTMFDRERIVYHRGGLVFALRGGTYAHVDDVPNGLACGCVCEECQATLVARNRGEFLASHFAHAAGEKCGNTGEAGMTRAAASILSETRRLMLPAVTVGQVLRDAHEITIDSAVALTVRGQVPEVRVTAGRRTLRLFVRPSTRTPPKARDDVVRQGLSAMQLDVLPNSDGVVTAGDLTNALTGRPYARRWLLNTRASIAVSLPLSPKLQSRVPSSRQSPVPVSRVEVRDRGKPGPRFCWKCGSITPFSTRGDSLRCDICGIAFLGDG